MLIPYYASGFHHCDYVVGLIIVVNIYLEVVDVLDLLVYSLEQDLGNNDTS